MMCSPGEKTSLIIVWTKRPLLSKISIEIRSFSGTENLNVIFGLNGFGKGEERKKEFGIVFCFVFRDPLWKVPGDPLSPFP